MDDITSQNKLQSKVNCVNSGNVEVSENQANLLIVNSLKVQETLVVHLRFNDTMTDILKRGGVLDISEGVAKDRLEWWELISNACNNIDNDRKEENKRRGQKTHQRQEELNFSFFNFFSLSYLSVMPVSGLRLD